jgi:hypothetical protein
MTVSHGLHLCADSSSLLSTFSDATGLEALMIGNPQGDMRYVHFASLFYIIIYYYSLIYFIFRDDTYVVSSVFTCFMIIGELAAGVRILLEKGPSRHHISEDQ